MCHRMTLMEPKCLYGGRGMTVWEFYHLLRRLQQQQHGSDHSNQTQSSAVGALEGMNAIRISDLIGVGHVHVLLFDAK